MASWQEVTGAAPQLADKIQQRFEAHGLAIIATVRRDGGPRISGIETQFGSGELWLGMMPGSFKAADLLREPRFALHCATVDKHVQEGDAKISGLAVHVEDEATFQAYVQASGGKSGPTLGSFHLFRLDVKEMSYLIPAGNHLDIEIWTETGGYRKVERK